ncbi:PREDICTED: perilipin-3-like isoform X2 [Priapulus caudatus]|uniref:Perilipin-3-like isoform X2 n=1 Tax=Priapulus caudatus TaxID=37621 RepID=A0ABM1EY60_PRICU|nr:PREDICTED: perilipin-3-like isoform X2 [Priapulus caudatus]
MYRKHLMEAENMTKETDGNQQVVEEVHFLQRVANYPVVSATIGQVTELYGRTKENVPLMKTTLDAAEKSVMAAATTAMPIVGKFQDQIEMVDNYACKGLDKLEESAPAIKKQPNELAEDTKRIYNSTVTAPIAEAKKYGSDKVAATRNYSIEKVEGVRIYSYDKLDAALQTKYGHMVIDATDKALTIAENYVDYYLPSSAAEGEESEGETPGKANENAGQLNRAVNLTNKTRRRMYGHSMRQLHNLQLRTRDAVDQLTNTINLISYAKTLDSNVRDNLAVAQDGVWKAWEDITTDHDAAEGEGDANAAPKTAEQKALLVARNVTRRLQSTYASVSASIADSVPASVAKQLQEAQKRIDELYGQFMKTTNLWDMPVNVLSLTKEKVGYLEETTLMVYEFLLSLPVVNWMVPNFDDGSGMEFDEKDIIADLDANQG